MSDEPNGNGKPPEAGTEAQERRVEAVPAPEEETSVETDGTVLEEMDRLRTEFEHLREMYLRKLAEFDNFRKRTERERQEMERRAGERLVASLVPVLDNFERALQHPEETEPAAFRKGIEMIAKQLWDVLQREGMTVLDPVDEEFDPELHEAVARVEDPAHEPGTVVHVMAKGYLLGGRLIRPAMVAVAVEAAPGVASGGSGGQES